jgi:hypothetical protein
MSKIQHPCFEGTQEMAPLTLATFKVPAQEITAAAFAFDSAARALVKKFKADLAAIPGIEEHRKFGGGVSLPYVHLVFEKPAAPRFEDKEIEAMRAAILAAYPGATLADEWHNQSNGWPGYSIRFRVTA